MSNVATTVRSRVAEVLQGEAVKIRAGIEALISEAATEYRSRAGATAAYSLECAAVTYAAKVEGIFGDARKIEGVSMSGAEYAARFGVSGARVSQWATAGEALEYGNPEELVAAYLRKPADYEAKELRAALDAGSADALKRAAAAKAEAREAAKAKAAADKAKAAADERAEEEAEAKDAEAEAKSAVTVPTPWFALVAGVLEAQVTEENVSREGRAGLVLVGSALRLALKDVENALDALAAKAEAKAKAEAEAAAKAAAHRSAVEAAKAAADAKAEAAAKAAAPKPQRRSRAKAAAK